MTDTSPVVSGDLADLESRLDGQLITATTPEYEQARMVADLTFNRRPLAIVRVTSVQDVIETVNFARDGGFALAVRSGGHSLAGHGTCDDGIVLDMSGMKAIVIDAANGKARVQAGAGSADLAGPANAHGFALSTGDTASVGLGGLVTGGGIGFFVRKHGLAIDNLLSAQVVTADGRLLTASANENPDLFWAIRGGGGNFGVVVEFEFKLAPVANILGGAIILPGTREVLRGMLEYLPDAPEDLTVIADVMFAPPAPFIPEAWLGKLVVMVLVCWTGDPAEGEKALAPLRALAEPVADVVQVMPYPGIFEFTAEASQPAPNVVRSMFTHEISDATLDHLLTAMETPSSPMCMIQFRGLGGAMARVDRDETAFGLRDMDYQATIIGLWQDLSEDQDIHENWVQSLWEKIRADSAGSYVNFLDDEGVERVLDSYPPATYARLREIKAKYDPANFFCLNQNIPPAQ